MKNMRIPNRPRIFRKPINQRHVASVHQLATQCFLQYGNAGHRKIAPGGRVSVSEFQEAVRERYVRNNGIINQEENIDDSSVEALGRVCIEAVRVFFEVLASLDAVSRRESLGQGI